MTILRGVVCAFVLITTFSFVSCSTEDDKDSDAGNEFTGNIFVEDQTLQNNTLIIKSVNMSLPGWVVLYSDSGNASPDMTKLISAPKLVAKGYSSNLILPLLPGIEITGEKTFWAMLHHDNGQLNTFEFTGNNNLDNPLLTSGNQRVMASFKAIKPDENTGSAQQPGSLVWQDEFNSGQLDTSKWNYETGTGINGDWGTGQLDRATSREKNVSFQSSVSGADGGCLVITTHKESYMDRSYTSGRINTSGKASWGPAHRIVARVMPKGVRHQGQGFAFWMMPAEKPAGYDHIMWPQGGEVDIMEYVGSIPYNNLGTVHYAWFWENNEYKDWNHGHLGAYYNYENHEVPNPAEPGYGNFPPPANATYSGSSGFHTYGIDWYMDRLEFFVDDNVYHVHYFNDGDGFLKDEEDEIAFQDIDGRRVGVSEYSNHFEEWSPFEHKMFAILSAGVGGSDLTYGGPIVPEAQFPAAVYIDWIRVYKLE